jgi:biotin carboxyl carrier protein
MRHVLALNGIDHALWLGQEGADYRLDTDAGTVTVHVDHENGHMCLAHVDGGACHALIAIDGDTVHVHLDGATYALRYRDPIDRFAKHTGAAADDVALAPMPGTVVSIAVAVGQSVSRGDTLLVIESMKLETAIKAWRDGTVEAVHVAQGKTFDRSAPLVTFAPESGA